MIDFLLKHRWNANANARSHICFQHSETCCVGGRVKLQEPFLLVELCSRALDYCGSFSDTDCRVFEIDVGLNRKMGQGGSMLAKQTISEKMYSGNAILKLPTKQLTKGARVAQWERARS